LISVVVVLTPLTRAVGLIFMAGCVLYFYVDHKRTKEKESERAARGLSRWVSFRTDALQNFLYTVEFFLFIFFCWHPLWFFAPLWLVGFITVRRHKELQEEAEKRADSPYRGALYTLIYGKKNKDKGNHKE